MSNLFRREAVDHATRRLTGEVVLATPLSVKLLGGLLGGTLLLALFFAMTATYARKETVTGWIVPQGGLIRVTTRDVGVVDTITVSEGDRVRVEQSLGTIRLSTASAAGDSSAAMSRDLAAEALANDAASSAAKAKLGSLAAELRSRREALLGEIAEVRSRLDVLEQRQQLANDQVKRGELLKSQGYMSQANLDAVRSSALVAAQDASEIRALMLGYKRQIGDIDRQLSRLPAEHALLAAQAAQTRAALAQRGVSLDAQTTFAAIAPIDGTVVAVPVERGQTVAAGAAIAVLAPRGSELIAELYVPSRAAGFIRPGQTVRLMYQAFPYQRFGAGSGVVQAVSSTVLSPSEVAIPGLTVQEPVFRVRIKLARFSVSAYGQEMPLQPGMLLTADIVVDRRTLIEWLLDPLYAAGRRA